MRKAKGAKAPALAAERVPVVGIGASAGGLEAFTTLLKALPCDTGMAFVLIQHMDPSHESVLSKILAKSTNMPVGEAADGVAVKPDSVYVIPSNADVTIREGVLRLTERQDTGGRHLPIDSFLRALAEDRKSSAVGVVLSGIASDGTEGLKAIKAEGGITFAQDEKSAKHRGMPMSAVAAGCVDFVLPPEGIARELAQMGRHPYVRVSPQFKAREVPKEDEKGFRKICALLRAATGVDFLLYKPATISRRIARRMAVQRAESLGGYAQLLAGNPAELGALFHDILIHVTGFFRDPQTFEALAQKVFPRILAGKAAEQPVRVWVPACSSGEEVYSIAMALVEHLGDRAGEVRIQIFGTDIIDASVQEARAGVYPESKLADVSPARLQRFFVKTVGGYQVAKPIREMCVFARQDVAKDPPFSKLDLISCRNMLIYMGPELQKKVLEVFHYALHPGGILFLGRSESINAYSSLFSLEDRGNKIFSRRPPATAPRVDRVSSGGGEVDRAPVASRAPIAAFDLRKEAERALLDRLSPAAIVVDSDLHIVHFQGDTSPYLAPATGEPSFHLLRMLRAELVVQARAAIRKVAERGMAVRTEAVRIQSEHGFRPVRLEVLPIKGRQAKGCDFLVVFQEPAGGEPVRAAAAERRPAKEPRGERARLERELASAREAMRSMFEDQLAAVEELKAANEEVLSSNEELQSTNEELETAKEELQSSNEELITLNEELHNRNTELGQLANDLSNLLVGVNIPILILDGDLRIRRFTPAAERTLNLIGADVGRPFSHIVSNLEVTGWDQMLAEVLDHQRVLEREVRDREGRWYSLRMCPYLTDGDKAGGVLMALLDIDIVKRSLEQVQLAREYAEAIVENIRYPLLVLDADLVVISANASFHQAFRLAPEDTVGRPLFDLGNGEWNIAELRHLLEEVLSQDRRVEDFEAVGEFRLLGRRHMLLSARRVTGPGSGPRMVLLAIEDATERMRAEEVRRATEAAALLESAVMAVVAVDGNGVIRIVNRTTEQMFGYSRAELVGQPLETLLPERLASRHREQYADYFRSPRNRPMGIGLELVARRKNGSEFPVEISLNHIATPDGVLGVSTIADITERKQSEAARLQYQRELQSLTARLIAVRESESKGLARELHDVFSQQLAGLGMEITAIEDQPRLSRSLRRRLGALGEQVGELAKAIHQKSRLLHPAILDDLGLAVALKNECGVFSQRHNLEVTFNGARAPQRLAEDVSLCLYRVAQECLRNAARHSKATAVTVNLAADKDDITLVVRDNGSGFDPGAVRRTGGLGLVSMEERVRLVNGELEIESQPGQGTTVRVRVPAGESADEQG